MTTRQERPPAALKGLINGYQVSQAIHVAAALGLADLLVEGPRTSDELADAAGAHPPSLYRLLRALASVGVLREENGRRFSLTPLGDALRSDAPEPIAGWAAFVGRPSYWQAWGHLLHSVLTGENAFGHVHGTDVWRYRAARPEESEIFDRAMTDLTRGVDRTIVEAHDFGRYGTVVDVGGGRGAFVAAVLTRYPAVKGILFDQPHVVATAEEMFREEGLADRCRVVAGSFFEAVPEGGDAYVLKAVIHDWEDEEAAAILRSCRRAIPPHGALLVIERVVGQTNTDPEAAFSDLNMLVSPGGRERTIEEFGNLFALAGFRLGEVTPTPSGYRVIQGQPV